MGKKLKDYGFDSGRVDLDTVNPEDLSLVWHKKTAEFGPRDFLISKHPELDWAFDPTIEQPFNDADVVTCMTKGKHGYIGILQAITYRKVLVGGVLHLIVMIGRGRTRICREANRRIRAVGGGSTDIIYIKAQGKDTSDEMAAIERDIENTARKEVTPMMIARLAKHHVEKGTPEALIAKACRVGSFAQVKNYLRLLEQPAEVQVMVEKGQIPMTARVTDVEKVAAEVEKKGHLTAKDVEKVQDRVVVKPLGKKEIQRWIEGLPSTSQGAMVKAILETVQGIGNMDTYPHLAPKGKE